MKIPFLHSATLQMFDKRCLALPSALPNDTQPSQAQMHPIGKISTGQSQNRQAIPNLASLASQPGQPPTQTSQD